MKVVYIFLFLCISSLTVADTSNENKTEEQQIWYPFSEIIDTVKVTGLFPNNYIKMDAGDGTIRWSCSDDSTTVYYLVHAQLAPELKIKTISDLKKVILNDDRQEPGWTTDVRRFQDYGENGWFELLNKNENNSFVRCRYFKVKDHVFRLATSPCKSEPEEKIDSFLKSFQVRDIVNSIVVPKGNLPANIKSQPLHLKFENFSLSVEFPKGLEKRVYENGFTEYVVENEHYRSSLRHVDASDIKDVTIVDFFPHAYEGLKRRGYRLISASNVQPYLSSEKLSSGFGDLLFVNSKGNIEQMRLIKKEGHIFYLSTELYSLDFPSPQEQIAESVIMMHFKEKGVKKGYKRS